VKNCERAGLRDGYRNKRQFHTTELVMLQRERHPCRPARKLISRHLRFLVQVDNLGGARLSWFGSSAVLARSFITIRRQCDRARQW
jgi:hypothetical protein